MQEKQGFDPSQFGETHDNAAQSETPDTGENNTATEDGQSGQNQQRPDMGNMFGSNPGQTGGSYTTIIYYGITAVVMVAAFLFALFYRRKLRKR